jgi:hypothetical protein
MPIEGTYMSTSANPFDASEELMAMILKAVNHGITLAEGKENRDDYFLPFVLTESRLIAIGANTHNAFLAVVQQVMSSGEEERCVLVYDGYLTYSSNRTNAVFVEGYEREKEKGLRFAQLYRPAIKGNLLRKERPLEQLGNLKYLAGNLEYRTVPPA